MKQKHLAVVAVLAIVLIVAVVLSVRMRRQALAPQNNNQGNVVQNSDNGNVIPPDGSQPPLAYQKEVLNFPGNDAPESERLRFFEKVQTLARDADFLEIKNDCQTYPMVMFARLGDNVTIKNVADSTSTIQVNNEHRYEIPGRGSKTIKADFGNAHGIFGYACNDSPKPVGLFFVVPK